MSRIGKRVLTIPANVSVDVNENKVTVKGPKGELSLDLIKTIKVNVEENTLTVEKLKEVYDVLVKAESEWIDIITKDLKKEDLEKYQAFLKQSAILSIECIHKGE